MNVFSHLHNSSWPSLLCCYQMNGIDIRLGYTKLRGILDGKQTIHCESISDILISMFLGINKCLQGRNIFMIDFGFVSISNIRNFINLRIRRISCLHQQLRSESLVYIYLSGYMQEGFIHSHLEHDVIIS